MEVFSKLSNGFKLALGRNHFQSFALFEILTDKSDVFLLSFDC
jgi:hypothetical protein